MNSMKITWLRRIIVTDSPWQTVIKNTINFNEIFSFGTSYIDLLLPKIKKQILDRCSKGHLLWTCPESQSLIRQLTNCLINKNVNLSFIEQIFIFNIGNTYTTADLQLFIITYCVHPLISITALYPHFPMFWG